MEKLRKSKTWRPDSLWTKVFYFAKYLCPFTRHPHFLLRSPHSFWKLHCCVSPILYTTLVKWFQKEPQWTRFFISFHSVTISQGTVELYLVGDISLLKTHWSTRCSPYHSEIYIFDTANDILFPAPTNAGTHSTGTTPQNILAPDFCSITLSSMDAGFTITGHKPIFLELLLCRMAPTYAVFVFRSKFQPFSPIWKFLNLFSNICSFITAQRICWGITQSTLEVMILAINMKKSVRLETPFLFCPHHAMHESKSILSKRCGMSETRHLLS